MAGEATGCYHRSHARRTTDADRRRRAQPRPFPAWIICEGGFQPRPLADQAVPHDVEHHDLEQPDALRYGFTIENPTAFTRPWTGAYAMTRTTDLIYEFACHEGNYGLANMLEAARYEERRVKP